MDASATAEKSSPSPENGAPLPEQFIVDQGFDQQFREWVAAEATVFMAIEHGGELNTSRLAELSADALEKHRLLWAGADALSTRVDEKFSPYTAMRISKESGLLRKR